VAIMVCLFFSFRRRPTKTSTRLRCAKQDPRLAFSVVVLRKMRRSQRSRASKFGKSEWQWWEEEFTVVQRGERRTEYPH